MGWVFFRNTKMLHFDIFPFGSQNSLFVLQTNINQKKTKLNGKVNKCNKTFGVWTEENTWSWPYRNLFPFFSSVCQENANNLFWFDLKQFIYHSWNMKRHCLPRSAHQLPGTLFLGELRRSRGLRETTVSCCQEGWCGVWAFWSQEKCLGAVFPTVPSGEEADVGRREIFY